MIRSMFKNAISVRAEDLLTAIGLERKRRAVDHVVTATTYFIAGAIFGGCIALLLAPTTGRSLRDALTERLRTAGERARRAADQMRERAERGARVGQSMYEEAAGTAS